MRRWAPGLLLLILLIFLGYALSPPGRRLSEALSLLADVWAVGRGPVEARPRERRSTEYAGPAGERRRADLYCDPRELPRARLLLAHGLADAGKDDARLVALGTAFARHRFLVLVPDFPGMRALRVAPQDIDEVAAGLEALGRLDRCPPAAARGPAISSGSATSGGAAPAPGSEKTRGSAPGGQRSGPSLPTGAVGFSYSAGPVLLALDRPGHLADFAVLFGGYYDLEDVVRFLTTGRHRDRGVDLGGEAIPEGRWILLGANAELLGNPADRAALLAISRRRTAAPAADIGDLDKPLGPAARAMLDLLANTDPRRFDPLLLRVDPALRRTLDLLSPAKSLARPLDVDLYLLHGRSDAIVPFTETLKLARAVRTTGKVETILLGGFRHARPEGTGPDPWWRGALHHPADSLHLLGVLEAILQHRA